MKLIATVSVIFPDVIYVKSSVFRVSRLYRFKRRYTHKKQLLGGTVKSPYPRLTSRKQHTVTESDTEWDTKQHGVGQKATRCGTESDTMSGLQKATGSETYIK
ncbi:hypothetical protein BaRGS_00005775 [Batillaria attramentaria]|uniref:Uncharacterized protein n=1 Tax=Batillaria attramentaria TaxID=370345 RepID=A0ABD0LU55_9CAEN